MAYVYRTRELATAEILYFLPDYPSLLQQFLWQFTDVPPKFPRFHKFLRYWQSDIDAVIFSVSVASGGLVVPIRVAKFEGRC